MTDFADLWWLDPSNIPESHQMAQPVWICGQWDFIPWVFGSVPLRKRCASLQEAVRVAEDYEQYISQQSIDSQSLQDLRRNMEFSKGNAVMLEGALSEYSTISVEQAGDGEDFQYLLMPDGKLCHRLFIDRNDAINHAMRLVNQRAGYGA